MRFNLSTMSRALQFRYTDDERLYTDHDGRRVIVDVEGSGEMRLMHAEPDVLTVREGEPPQMFCPKFEDGSIVLAEGPGPTHIQVAFPFIPNLSSAKSEEVTLPIRGCGWLIGASNRVVVDDLHEWSPDPSPQFPVPYRLGAEGSGWVTVVPVSNLRCELASAFDIDDDAGRRTHHFQVQNLSAVRVLESQFEDGAVRAASVACHLNAAEFEVEFPSNNIGILLRKIYDRFHGRQRARVLIDGIFAGWWYEPGEDRKYRWHVSDFGVPASLTEGKAKVRITVDPPAGVALWSLSRIEVYVLRPNGGIL